MNARSTLVAATVAFAAAGLLRSATLLTAQAPQAPAMPSVPANLGALETHLADIRMLTDKGENAEAYFSPDGTQLIFQSSPDPVSCDQMYVMKIDGTDRRRVSNGEGRTTCGFFTTDARQITYASTHGKTAACPERPSMARGYVWPIFDGYDIYKANADGSGAVALTRTPGYDAEATMGPNGRIVFTSVRDGDMEIYTMAGDGSDVKRLTNLPGPDGGAFYSPDGTQIVFRGRHPQAGTPEFTEYFALLKDGLWRPTSTELYIMNADGSRLRQITDNGAANFAPFWTPDGKRLIFSSNLHNMKGRNFDLFLIDGDGSGLEQVTHHPDFDGFPMFSPDGKTLVFASNRQQKTRGDTNIFTARWKPYVERARQLLRDLVAINSVNPSLVPGAPGEADAAACLAACLRESGLDVTVTEVAPGRPNVVGVLDGAQPGPTLLLCGHLDTVGVEGMDSPFTPVERDGRLYGRGTQDMKAGVAACVGAVRLLAAEGLAKGRVLIAGVVDEEYASLGAEALVRDWRADGAVITEPTDLSVAVAHKGFAWLELQTFGKAAHGSRPDEGRDAILAMGRVLGVLERFDQELRARPTHPLLGSGSLHASTIAGGTEASVYPAHCRLFMERRTLPGEDGARALHEVEQMLAVLRKNDPEFRAEVRLVVERPGYDLDQAAELPQQLVVAGRARGLEARISGMTYWTDAAIFGGAGIPTVIFGPRGAGLHSPVEYVELSSVDECAFTLAALARQFLG